jgi:hypothetical protein
MYGQILIPPNSRIKSTIVVSSLIIFGIIVLRKYTDYGAIRLDFSAVFGTGIKNFYDLFMV